MSPAPLFLIVDDRGQYWRRPGRGVTTNRAEAHRYTAEDVEQHRPMFAFWHSRAIEETAVTTAVYIVEGEHPNSNTLKVSAHASEAGAVARCVELVQQIVSDVGFDSMLTVTAENWARTVERLEDHYGAANCTVGYFLVAVEP